MDREVMQKEGRLSIKTKEAKRLELSIQSLIESVRLHLDPTEIELLELNMPAAFQEMTELMDKWATYKGLRAEIKSIKKVLGR